MADLIEATEEQEAGDLMIGECVTYKKYGFWEITEIKDGLLDLMDIYDLTKRISGIPVSEIERGSVMSLDFNDGDPVVEKINQMAKEQGISVNSVIVKTLVEYIEDQKAKGIINLKG